MARIKSSVQRSKGIVRIEYTKSGYLTVCRLRVTTRGERSRRKALAKLRSCIRAVLKNQAHHPKALISMV